MKTIFVKVCTIVARVLAVSFVLTAGRALTQEAAGNWGGLLAGQLHIIVHVTKNADGHYSGSLESPDQGAFVLQAENVEVTQDHLGFTVPRLGGRYDGDWDASQQAWVGIWKQGQSLPLNLSHLNSQALSALRPKRPQEDAIAAAPGPYQQHEVTFDNPSARIKLAGTFSVPEGAGPFPGVVLICGSGPHTRDEDVFGHRIFLVLADALNRHGIAVLRYDKRGVGDSTGDFAAATSVDFASDVDAAIAFLNTRPEVDKKHIGLIGHSEGGAIAPSIAVRNPSVAFSVLMAGPAMRTDRLTILQEALIARAAGTPDDSIAKRRAFSEKLYAGLMAAQTREEALSIARTSAAQAVADHVVPAEAADGTVRQVTSPWFLQALSYDPALTLRKLKTPVLVLNGSLDLQVPSKENLALMRAVLKDNKGATVIELPNLNHMFQTAKTGSPAEYSQIEETISPAALKVITDWVTASR